VRRRDALIDSLKELPSIDGVSRSIYKDAVATTDEGKGLSNYLNIQIKIESA
jgi:hypothetical protein